MCNQKFCFQALEAEKESTKTRSIGIAFVTFANLDDARKVDKRQLSMLHSVFEDFFMNDV